MILPLEKWPPRLVLYYHSTYHILLHELSRTEVSEI